MSQLVLTHADGSVSAVEVNDASTLSVKTWRPPQASEGTMQVLIEDQSFSLAGVVAVSLDDPSAPAEKPKGRGGRPKKQTPGEALADEPAAQADADAAAVAEPKPWEDEAA